MEATFKIIESNHLPMQAVYSYNTLTRRLASLYLKDYLQINILSGGGKRQLMTLDPKTPLCPKMCLQVF